MASVLFDEEGFIGNATEFYDPRNSFLNDVIDRKTGIPITLSIVFLEVCWRVNLDARGVGLPGHFIVIVAAERPVLVDPFNRRYRLTLDDCAALVERGTGRQFDFQPRMLEPLSRRQIVSRVLRNLANIYAHALDDGRLLAVLDRLAIVDPTATTVIRDRAIVCQRIGFFGQALADCRWFIQRAPTEAASLGMSALLSSWEADLRWNN